ncbi:glycosyltransferase [Endozoicomonas lisbonensis]|uniref:Glycosyltransferase involved in cell wall biosynthesis n=1 Tax=Endozoicomonas lisbonensis TaxID=3120522 RepID=A0ABV2SMM1_9GAMM
MQHNILFGAYPWAFDCPGGGERQLMAWKSHLEAQNHQVTLYNPWEPVPENVKIFHYFSVMPGSYQLCEYIKSKEIRLVISPNLWVTPKTKWHYPHDEIQRLISIADLLIVNSQQEAATLSEVYSLPAERFHVAYNGVEESFLKPGNPELFREQFLLGEKKFFINVANIEPRKNQLTFLKALKHFPELSLIVIGHARDESYFRSCREVGGDQFVYIGPLPYGSDILKSALAGAEGFVMPSTVETPSIAALEAAASGCRVLITRVGSTTEYFGDEVVYINPDDSRTIVEGIVTLLQGVQGKLQKSIRDKFTWVHSARQLSLAYQKVL